MATNTAEYQKAYRTANKIKIAEQKRQHRLKNPTSYLNSDYKRRYGVTYDQIEEIRIAQHNLCAICNNDLGSYCVDHCHKTSKVRGLLCNNCNVGIGLFKDSTYNLTNAISYLKANR